MSEIIQGGRGFSAGGIVGFDALLALMTGGA